MPKLIGTALPSAVFDRLGVQRSGTGVLSAGVTRQVYGGGNEDGLAAQQASSRTSLQLIVVLPGQLPTDGILDLGEAIGDCKACLKNIYDRASKEYPGVKDGSFQNAMRHCVATCLARRECGAHCAHLIFLREWDPRSRASNEIDQHNNRHGYQVGGTSENCHKGCGRLWNEGKLK